MNDKPARASYEVKEGDIIGIDLGARSLRAKVVSVKETAGKEEAALMYQLLD